MARAHGSYPWCRWFKSSSRYYYGIIAQLGEHLPYKQRVIGSSPVGPMVLLYMVISHRLLILEEYSKSVDVYRA